MTVKVGDVAPAFHAPGTAGRDYSLEEYRGQPVVLVFYPGDSTPVCTKQLRSYSAGAADFNELNAVVLALSPQNVDSHEKFAGAQSLNMPLLCDTDKEIAGAYGVLGPLGFYRRSVFVIGADGTVAYAKRGLTGLTFVKTEELLEAVRNSAS